MERLGNVTTLDDVLALDAAGKIERKFSAAPIKDTVSVPDGGYAVVRFIADNPGKCEFFSYNFTTLAHRREEIGF